MLGKYVSGLLAFGALAAVANESAFVSGDISAGRQLYDAQCAVCHGPGGASIVPTQPILAGQHAEYTASQLRKFRDGGRKNAAMAPFVVNLDDDDIADLAFFLAQQMPVIAGAADMNLAKAGEKLYRGGDSGANIPACAACHGPAGEGIAPLYPRLSGQYAEYVALALRQYASGERQADAMTGIAAKLSDEEIEALASYISGLAP